MLGSFKSLGGMYAGLRALAHAAGAAGVAALLAPDRAPARLPALICASDGNHGLAVAAAAHLAGAQAHIYLHEHVAPLRAARIRSRGAEVVWVHGTYDDAVEAAERVARRGDGLLIADTTSEAADPVVADVMAGYGVIAAELLDQLHAMSSEAPTHLFVQAGVGGLAAAMAEGLASHLAPPARIIVVEPARCACVAAAIEAGRPVRVPGDLASSAEMLSAGLASAPALALLARHKIHPLAIEEPALEAAARALPAAGGPLTTPSGTAGLAGLLAASPGSALAAAIALTPLSRVLLIATEGSSPTPAPA